MISSQIVFLCVIISWCTVRSNGHLHVGQSNITDRRIALVFIVYMSKTKGSSVSSTLPWSSSFLNGFVAVYTLDNRNICTLIKSGHRNSPSVHRPVSLFPQPGSLMKYSQTTQKGRRIYSHKLSWKGREIMNGSTEMIPYLLAFNKMYISFLNRILQ